MLPNENFTRSGIGFWSVYGKKTLIKDGREWQSTLAKMFFGAFLLHHMEKPEWTYWPTQYDMEWWLFGVVSIHNNLKAEVHWIYLWLLVKMW